MERALSSGATYLGIRSTLTETGQTIGTWNELDRTSFHDTGGLLVAATTATAARGDEGGKNAGIIDHAVRSPQRALRLGGLVANARAVTSAVTVVASKNRPRSLRPQWIDANVAAPATHSSVPITAPRATVFTGDAAVPVMAWLRRSPARVVGSLELADEAGDRWRLAAAWRSPCSRRRW